MKYIHESNLIFSSPLISPPLLSSFVRWYYLMCIDILTFLNWLPPNWVSRRLTHKPLLFSLLSLVLRRILSLIQVSSPSPSLPSSPRDWLLKHQNCRRGQRWRMKHVCFYWRNLDIRVQLELHVIKCWLKWQVVCILPSPPSSPLLFSLSTSSNGKNRHE